MFYRLVIMMLAMLTGACGTIAVPAVATSTPDQYISPIPTPGSMLAARVRQTIAPYPAGNWCDQSISRQPIEAYNTSLAQALADLLAAPEAANLSDSELAHIYADGAYPRSSIAPLVSGGDGLLTILPTYYESCVMGSHYIPVLTRLLVFDRAGHWQTIKTITSNAESGTFILATGAVQWAGDRWVVMLNDLNTMGFTGYEVVHILHEGDNWVIKTGLKAVDGDQSYRTPTMRLVNGYKTIALTRVRYDEPPCTLDANIMDRYAWTIYTTEHTYDWDGGAYILSDARNTDVKVILYAGEHRETYTRLYNWQFHCST